MSQTVRLFIYATLKNHSTFKKVVGHNFDGEEAVLPGYEEFRERVDGQLFPTVVPHPSQNVTGEVLNVTQDDLHKLDAWEEMYTRKRLPTSAGHSYVYVFTGSKHERAA